MVRMKASELFLLAGKIGMMRCLRLTRNRKYTSVAPNSTYQAQARGG